MLGRIADLTPEALALACAELKNNGYVEIPESSFVIIQQAEKRLLYAADQPIKKGSFGTIYPGYEIEKERVASAPSYAIKIITPMHLIPNDYPWQTRIGTLERSQEECRVAQVELHKMEVPAIKLSYDKQAFVIEVPNDQVAIVSRFLPYPDLIPDPIADDKDRGKLLQPYEGLSALPYVSKIKLIKSLFEGLALFHAADLVHGDIRGSNVKINLDDKANPKLILLDFGNTMVCPLDKLIQFKETQVGSQGYMLPEYFSEEGVMISHKSDVGACLPLIYSILGEKDPWLEKTKIVDKHSSVATRGMGALKNEIHARYVFNDDYAVPIADEKHWRDVALFQKQFFERMERVAEHERPTSQEGVLFYSEMEHICDHYTIAHLAKLAIIAAGIGHEIDLAAVDSLTISRLQAIIKIGRFRSLEADVVSYIIEGGVKQDTFVDLINYGSETMVIRLLASHFYYLKRESEDTELMSPKLLLSPLSPMQRIFSWMSHDSSSARRAAVPEIVPKSLSDSSINYRNH